MRLTEQGIAYTWRQLAQRIGLSFNDNSDTGFESLGISVYYDHPKQANTEQLSIVIIPSSQTTWYNLLNLPPHSLDWLSIENATPAGSQPTFDGLIPVLFWGASYEDGHKPFAERLNDKCIVFYADIIAATFFMLSRWEETVVDVRDEHERFPATASVAYKQGFLDRPIVDEYALILREWVKLILPNWRPKLSQFSIKLSHDIDHVRRFLDLHTVFRSLGRSLLIQFDLRNACQICLDAVSQTIRPDQTPEIRGIEALANLSNRYGFNSAFYFMTAKPGPRENDYDLAVPKMRELALSLESRGFEIGFHPGYDTLNNPSLLFKQKAQLDAIIGKTEYGGRQHYLRFSVPKTWRDWEQAGLIYDSTLGYADHEGFRGGTCHPFQPFDLEQDCQLNLWELPLIVMDGTLKQYRQLTPAQGLEVIMSLARKCKRVRGTFTLLWHNSSIHGDWFFWFVMYQNVLNELTVLKDYDKE